MPALKCDQCEFAAEFSLTASAAWYASCGAVHKAIPDELKPLRDLMAERKNGWNGYTATKCTECFERGLEQATEGCEGILHVELG